MATRSQSIRAPWAGRNMWPNFIECLRTRSKPNADIETGYLSTALCHLGNIAYRLRRSLKFDPSSQRFPDDAEANALLGRTWRPPFVVPDKV